MCSSDLEAVCKIYLLDPRYKQLGQFLPSRFSDSWVEGKRTEVVLSVAERNTSYRLKVLGRDKNTCRACGFFARETRMLDVHHLNPIAEGQRKTTLNDLVTLCPRCHRKAHTKSPPLSVEEIKLWAEKDETSRIK